MGDLLQMKGVNSKGYGIIPKMVMQDRRLSSTSKAIYAYFCSYAGAGRTAFPSVSKIISDLGISRGSYYKHFGPLKEHGYVLVEQDKDKYGKFVRNLYTLVERLPCSKNCETVKSVQPCTKLPNTVKPNTDNCDTAINIINNSFKNNRSNSISQSVLDRQEEEIFSPDAWFEIIQSNINYTDLLTTNPMSKELIDEIVGIIVDALIGKEPSLRIDSEMKPRTLVKRQFMLLGYEHIQHVLEQFQSHVGRIKRKRQYLLTMLYNSTLELDAHMTNWVSTDMAEDSSPPEVQKIRSLCGNTESGCEQNTPESILSLQYQYTTPDGPIQDPKTGGKDHG